MTDQERAVLIREIRKETGIIVSDDRRGMETLIGYLAETIPAEILELAESKVDMFSTYSMRESGVPVDGSTTWTHNTAAGRMLYAVGIAEEGIAQGREYTAFLWLHELCHVLCGRGEDHTPLYHAMLDQLLLITNEATGEDIQNDYQGLCPAQSHFPAP